LDRALGDSRENVIEGKHEQISKREEVDFEEVVEATLFQTFYE
jgi:hypothetical protein